MMSDLYLAAPTNVTEPTRPQKWRQRWTLIGWLTIVVAILVWCIANTAFAVSFQEQRAKTVAAGTAWQTDPVTITMNVMMHGTSVTLPGQDPVLADPNTVFVVAVLDYALNDTSDTIDCSMALVGKGRQWSPMNGLSVEQVAPGIVHGCNSTDADGNFTTSGQMGAIFEIPRSALPEIQGVQTTVLIQDLSNGWSSLYKHRLWMALMDGVVS